MGILAIIGLILFVCLVVVHEYGHYKAAKKGGIHVEEFGIGFPPRVWGKKLKSGMLLTLNLLPLGGFVRLQGEHDADTTPGSYGAASLKTKIKVLLAGVFMNLVTALGLLTLLALIGMPQLVPDQFNVASDSKIVKNDVLVGYVEPGSPAEKAGLQLRDKLIAVGSLPCSNEPRVCDPIEKAEDLRNKTEVFENLPLTLQYERDGKIHYTEAQLRSQEEVEASKNSDEPKGYLGIGPSEYTVRRATWSAPITAVGTAGQFTWLTLKGIGTAVADIFKGDSGKAAEQVSGPVGIFVLIRDGSLLGFEFILMIIAVISLTLALMNALPIPALDGGKLFVTLLFRALKKPLTKRTEELIHGLGFMLLMGLFVLITIVDVRRFF